MLNNNDNDDFDIIEWIDLIEEDSDDDADAGESQEKAGNENKAGTYDEINIAVPKAENTKRNAVRLNGRKRIPRYAKILMVVAAVVIVIAAAIPITWYSMISSGKKNLYAKNEEQIPILIKDNAAYAYKDSKQDSDTDGLQSDGGETINGDDAAEKENEIAEAAGEIDIPVSPENFEVIESTVPEADRVVQGDDANIVVWNGKKYVYNKNILTFLIMGIDTDNAAAAKGQSDANFLVVLNPDNRTIQIIAINRDTIADVDYYYRNNTFAYTKKGHLCIQHGYGASGQESAQLQVKAVSRLMYNIPIHGYAAINMYSVPDINDAVGGVTLECIENLSGAYPELTAGNVVTLKGGAAYEYVHWRDHDFEGARRRLARQKQYITAYINQAKQSVASNPFVVFNLYSKLVAGMTTDLSVDKAVYLADTALGYTFDSSGIITLEGTTRYGVTYAGISGNTVVYDEFYPDEEKLKQLIVRVFYKEV